MMSCVTRRLPVRIEALANRRRPVRRPVMQSELVQTSLIEGSSNVSLFANNSLTTSIYCSRMDDELS